MRKPHEWVLFQVNKIHKPNCPTKKTNSKRKTLNGCCQICIKTVKMSQKREKPQGGRPWKLGERKWRFWREVEDEWAAAFFSCRPNSWSYHPLPLRITKLPLWAAELQKCHSGPQMLTHWLCWRGNDMEMMWQWCGKFLQLNINVQAPKLLHPNT